MKRWRCLNSESIATLWVLLCTALALAPAPILGSVSSQKLQFRGISPQDETYYKSSDMIKCRDGSNKFSKAQLNDDYCDCPDGTDEPGTSACSSGRFYCRNAGHVPLLLFSSRVNDGICDCCDGSDEYDSKVKCPNTCWEAGKVARDKLKKKIATFEEGVKIRKQEVEHAKVAITKDETEILKLKNEEKVLKGLVEQLKERKEQIEKVEEEERLQNEKEEEVTKRLETEKDETKRIELTETANVGESKTQDEDNWKKNEAIENDDGEYKQGEGNDDDKIGNWEHSTTYEQDRVEEVDSELETQLINKPETEASLLTEVEEETAVEKDKPLSKSETVESAGTKESSEEVSRKNDASSEELSREELGRLVASRWTGENTGENTEEQSGNVDSTIDSDEESHDIKDSHDNDGYASEADDDNQRYDDDLEENYEDIRDGNHDDSTSSERYYSDTELDSPDVENQSNPTWVEKIQKTVRNVLNAVNIFQSPVNQSDAANVRKEYEESSARLSKIQSRISNLSQKLKNDFGPEKEFYSFYDQCFESNQNKYVYKVCPYKQASQVEGHSTTRLGRWEKFEDSYRAMIFSSGDTCWNGPDRSLKVKLRCGLKNDVTDVDEPSRCEYVALLSTPVACVEEKLQELRNKLEMLNKEEAEKHDEL